MRYRASLSVLLCKQRLMVSALLLRCSLSVVVCVRERDNAAARSHRPIGCTDPGTTRRLWRHEEAWRHRLPHRASPTTRRQIANAVMDAHVDLPTAPIELPGTTTVSGEGAAPGGLEGEWSFDGTLDELNQHVNLDEWEDCV